MGLIKESKQELEKPLEVPLKGWGFLGKKGKIECNIIYEDQSYNTFYMKFDKPGEFTIKKRVYFIHPKAFLLGKPVKAFWYFDNPVPIFMEYQKSKLTAAVLNKGNTNILDEEMAQLSKIIFDAESIHTIFTSNVIKGLYFRPWLTGKIVIIILVIVLVIVFVILQATGTVDFMGMLTGGTS